MDDDIDFGEDLDEDDDDIDLDEDPDRFLRATIADGQITLNPFLDGTIIGGPASMLLARLDGAHLLDLRFGVADAEELVATVPSNAPALDRAARRVLADWAALVGFRRLWLADRVLDLEAPATLPTMTVRCPTCTSVWTDGSPPFWAMVREDRHFPGWCPACAGSLPEWRPVRATAPQRVRAAAPRAATRSGGRRGP